MTYKENDWAIFEMNIVQVTELRENGGITVSDGSFNTSGNASNIMGRMRDLTLRNKRIAEAFEYYYKELRKINGEGGFNYPDIHGYFSEICLEAMDAPDGEETYEKAAAFVKSAKQYEPIIDGVKLFRSAR